MNLGVLYENGEGVEADLGEAARWYRQAAADGVVLAQLTLGLMYREGRGVPRDDGRSRALVARAWPSRASPSARSISLSCISMASGSRGTMPGPRRF